MRRAAEMSTLIISRVPGGALAQSCEQEVGPEFATVYVEQCLDFSLASDSPCEVENSCQLIQNGPARPCAADWRPGRAGIRLLLPKHRERINGVERARAVAPIQTPRNSLPPPLIG